MAVLTSLPKLARNHVSYPSGPNGLTVPICVLASVDDSETTMVTRAMETQLSLKRLNIVMLVACASILAMWTE